MAAAQHRQRSEYVQEAGNAFLALFPFRYSYISAPFPDPGQKPNWMTESRHPLSDRLILQGVLQAYVQRSAIRARTKPETT